MHRALASAVVIVTGACVPDLYSISIAPRDVGTARARMTGFFATESGGHHEGLTLPEGLPHTAIDDEATLVRIPPGEVCIDVTIRNAADYDFNSPFEDYKPTLDIDGVRVDVTITNGRASAGKDIVQRRGRVCARATSAKRIQLHMVNPILVWRSSISSRVAHYELAFTWRLDR